MLEKLKSDFNYSDIETKIGSKSLSALIIISTALNLFFIQGLRAYFSGIRAALFHVVFGEDVLMNLLPLLTLIFFFLPALTITICKMIGMKRLLFISIYVIIIVRLLWALHLPINLDVIYTGLIVVFYGFYMSTLLTLWIEQDDDIERTHKIIIIIFSFVIAFFIDYLIRTIGFTQDISLSPPGLIADWRITQYFWLFIQIPLTVLCLYLTKLYFPRFSTNNITSPSAKRKNKNISTAYSLVFSGIGLFLFLQFNLFLYPNGIAQYTTTPYLFNNILNIISLMISICAVLFIKIEIISSKRVIFISNGFMILSLCFFFFLGKILTYLASIFISISLVVMYLNVYLLFIWLSKINFKWERVKTFSNAFSIGLAFMILFSFLHAFTTEWASIIAALKNFGPLIMILAALIFSITVFYTVIVIPHKEDSER
ncbi:hypothetical protein LCGC14_1567330 [marine sediment metagenome]|uniref:Uncharacterized protein n=1 Tax=marine sediment metagenome TaxID=412755 RepID=A0A0F9J6Y0_9ZZZZ